MARNHTACNAVGPDAEIAPYISPVFMEVFKLYVGNLEFETRKAISRCWRASWEWEIFAMSPL